VRARRRVEFALPLALGFAPPLACPLVIPSRARRRRFRRIVARQRRPTAVIACAASSTLPLAIARKDLGSTSQPRIAIEVLGLDIRDVEKAVTPHREIDKRGLDGRLNVDDLALVNVARIALVARSLHVKLFKNTILDDCDPAFLGLKHVDQHFFLHAVSFRDMHRQIGVLVRLR
jgi:hypothetical protein